MVTAPLEVWRNIDAGSYRVMIAPGMRHFFGAAIVDAAPAHHYAVISDDTVSEHYAGALVRSLSATGTATLHTIPAGEEHKTRSSWAALTDAMIEAGCGRDTTVVALGGGVVGDLAGFVAATYMRGVPVVQCPTSLLAMIDASVGGKTGVDTPTGKNLVGAFHPPAAVLIDVEMIATLPLAHRRAGLAEAIKHGIIADRRYLAQLAAAMPRLLDADPVALFDCVTRSVEIKSAIVAADPRESGQRRTLNFGHTLGHALELVSGFTLLHGEAVAIGMVLEARLAARLAIALPGTCGEIEEIVRLAGLPITRPPALDPKAILAATHRDKKVVSGTVGYAFPRALGEMAGAEQDWLTHVPDSLILEVLA